MWQVVLFNVTNGLIIGAFYVLMALGLSLILNLSNVINFAHGNFLALGGYLAYSWNDFTGGFDGLRDFHREPIGFGAFTFDITQGETRFYFFLLAIFAAAVAVMGLLLRSPFGRTLVAIRENERRARFLGIPVERHIWMSFSISCFFTALAGTLYALLNNFADPLTLHYSLSVSYTHLRPALSTIGKNRPFQSAFTARWTTAHLAHALHGRDLRSRSHSSC